MSWNVFELILTKFGMGASLLGYVLFAIVLTGIAGKLHEKDGWMAWVPILNVAYLFRLAGMSWAWMLLALFLWIPIVGFIVSLVLLFALVTAWWRIAERRNKPGALALLMPIPVVNVFVGFYIAYSR